MIFPSNGPQRFLGGTTLMVVGSACLLATQLVTKDREEVHEVEEGYDSATAITALVICAFVLALSIPAFIFHFINLRRMEEIHRSAEDAADNDRSDGEERQQTIWEWFFYPERETVPVARHYKLVRRARATYRQLSWNSRARILLLAPAVALFGLLVVRLYWGADNFDGLPYYLDFGWKYGLLPHNRNVFEDGDELYHEPAEKSTSYIPEFNSYVHAGQGFLSALLAFPVVSSALLRATSTNRWWRNIVHLAPFVLSIYPTYNIIKRLAKASSAFAGSSFANNSFEWASGFMAASAIGNLLTSMVLRRRLSQDSLEHSSSIEEDDNNYKKEQKVGFCFKILQTILGSVFVLTVFTAAVYFTLTWHSCLKGSPDECVNHSDDGDRVQGKLFATLLLIPVLVFLATFIMECRRR